MKHILFIALLLLTVIVKGQNYDVSLIPKELMPYANSVVRNSEESIEVKDLDNVIIHVKKAITILNKNGDENAHVVVFHDKSRKIRYIKGTIYDSYGKLTGKFS